MTYDLNGASAKEAMLFFLSRERERHLEDVRKIDLDIVALMREGVELPDFPPLDTFIVIKGGNDGSAK